MNTRHEQEVEYQLLRIAERHDLIIGLLRSINLKLSSIAGIEQAIESDVDDLLPQKAAVSATLQIIPN